MRTPVAVIGLWLMILGACLVLAGLLPFRFKLPGDIVLRRGDFTFYFPITTSILLSIVVTLVIALLTRYRWPP